MAGRYDLHQILLASLCKGMVCMVGKGKSCKDGLSRRQFLKVSGGALAGLGVAIALDSDGEPFPILANRTLVPLEQDGNPLEQTQGGVADHSTLTCSRYRMSIALGTNPLTRGATAQLNDATKNGTIGTSCSTRMRWASS